MDSSPLPTLRYSDIGSSLLALSVAPRDACGVPEITPRFSKKSVSSGGLLNRIWEVIFYVVDYFRSPQQSYRRSCLFETLVRTQESFQKRVHEVSNAYQQYRAYLQDIQAGKKSDRGINRTRLIISEWNASMRAPEGSTLQEMIVKANQAYTLAMRGLGSSSHEAGLVQYQAVFEEIAECQKIVDFEEDLEESLPFDVLAKLCHRGCSLDVVDQDTLKQWIAKVNGCWRINVRTVHRALKSVVRHLGHPDAGVVEGPSHLAFLEYNLRKHGLELLDRLDCRHLRWRSQLERTQIGEVNGTRYELENRLGPPQYGIRTDAHLVFPIRGDKTHVLVTGLNEALLGIEAADAAENPGVIPLAMMRFMDSGGRSALYERLVVPLAHYRWKSGHEELDEAEDPVVLGSLVDLLSVLVRQEKTPAISVQDLMFNAKNELRLMRKVKMGPRFDYDRIVKLAYDASNGSLAIFRHLMEASGLYSHPVVSFYDEVVQDTLKGLSAVGVDEVAARRDLSDSNVRSRAKSLSQDVATLWQRSYTELTLRYEVPRGITRDVVEREIAGQILALYRGSKSVGLLWPTLDERIVASAANRLGLK